MIPVALSSPILLLVSQSHYGIDFRGAAFGDVSRKSETRRVKGEEQNANATSCNSQFVFEAAKRILP